MLIYYIISFVVSLFVIYIMQKISLKLNIVDKPNERKVHDKPKALLGGLAIYIGIFFTYSLFIGFNYNFEKLAIAFLGLALVLVGLVDDIKDLKATKKLFFQLVIAFLTSLVLGGINKIEIYNFIVNFNQIEGIILETIWLVALINAFNLIDGLDGLASGVGIISLFSLLILAIINSYVASITLILIIIGALLAFLYYNFNPSSIFLGDSGSMFIGYLIGLISMDSYKTVTLTSMLLLLLIAFMPFLDVFLAIIRRKNNKQKAFEADSLHFHHRLMRKGFSHTQAVLTLYIIMGTYSFAAVLLEFMNNPILKAFLMLFILIMTVFIFEKLYLLSDKHAYVTKIFNKLKINKK